MLQHSNTHQAHTLQRQSEKELHILKDALLRGGIAPDFLEALLHGHPDQPRKDSASAPGGWTETAKTAPIRTQYSHGPDNDNEGLHANHPSTRNTRIHTAGDALAYTWEQQEYVQMANQDLTWQQQKDFGGRPYSFMSSENAGIDTENTDNYQAPSTPFARDGQRTLLITGLSDRITYKDLTSVIRGGRILYLTIRNDRTATVFMLEGAAEFLAHVKRHDLYVQAKRLNVKWNDHQFTLSPYVGRKIASGATRNLVLRNAAQIVNIACIREHMEHIHKFDIIDIVIRGRDVFVYTNSVHNALFARTCMISRQPYKGLRIEFFPDECAAPLPIVRLQNASRTPSGTVVKQQATSNLFEMLSLDSDEENRVPGRKDDDDDSIDDDVSSSGVCLY